MAWISYSGSGEGMLALHAVGDLERRHNDMAGALATERKT